MYNNWEVEKELIVPRIHFPETKPDLIVWTGPARSGTTAKLREFANAKILSYRHPIKLIARYQLHEETFEFTIPDVAGPIFLKEGFGLTSTVECQLNAVEMLVQAGYPVDKITQVIAVRDPLATLASWIEAIGDVSLAFDRWVEAYMAVLELYSYAEKTGIVPVSYVYEGLRDHGEIDYESALFRTLGLSSFFSPSIIQNWAVLRDGNEMANEHLKLIPDPLAIRDSGPTAYGNDKILKLTGLQYVLKPTESIRAVVPEDLGFSWQMEEAYYGVYVKVLAAANSSLGLETNFLDRRIEVWP